MNETITWHEAAAELPDDETTVLVQSPDGSEPVWPGFHDERGWHWIESTERCIAVTAWADMPAGPTPQAAGAVPITGRLTRSTDGIFLHVTKRDGGAAGMRLDGTLLENWAREQLGPNTKVSHGGA